MPSDQTANTAFPEFRTTYKIQPVAIENSTTATYDLLIVKCPGDVAAFYYACALPGTDFKTFRPFTDPMSPLPPLPGGFSCGVVYAQPTMQGDAVSVPTFEVAGGAAGPVYHDIPCAPVGGNLRWRKTASSITVHVDCPAAFDQGMCYATQVPASYRNGELQFSAGPGVINDLPVNVMYRQRLVNLPFDEETMAAVDPKLYVTEARNGVYQPLRYLGSGGWVEPDHAKAEAFTPVWGPGPDVATEHVVVYSGLSDPTVSFAGVTPLKPIPQAPIFSVTDGSGNWNGTRPFPCPTLDNSPTIPADSTALPLYPSDSGYDHWMTSVIIFRGLSTTASVSVTTHDVIEQCPLGTSLFRCYVAPPPLACPGALLLYARIAEQSRHSYPASYNSWGTVWRDIKSVASKVWKVVGPVAPLVISTVADGAVSPEESQAILGVASRAVKVLARRPPGSAPAKPKTPKPVAMAALKSTHRIGRPKLKRR